MTTGSILAMRYRRDLYSTGYRNPNDDLLDVNAQEQSEIASIRSAGTLFGALLSAPFADVEKHGVLDYSGQVACVEHGHQMENI